MILKIILALVAIVEFGAAEQNAREKDICWVIINCTIILSIVIYFAHF